MELLLFVLLVIGGVSGGSVAAKVLSSTPTVLWTNDNIANGYPNGWCAWNLGPITATEFAVSLCGSQGFSIAAVDAHSGNATWVSCTNDTDPPSVIAASHKFQLVFTQTLHTIHAHRFESGEPAWAFTPLTTDGMCFPVSSLVGDIVLTICCQQLTALDARTGATLWESKYNCSYNSFAVSGNVVVYTAFVNYAPQLIGLEMTTGKQLWNISNCGANADDIVSAGALNMFVTAGFSRSGAIQVTAIEAATGSCRYATLIDGLASLNGGVVVVGDYLIFPTLIGWKIPVFFIYNVTTGAVLASNLTVPMITERSIPVAVNDGGALLFYGDCAVVAVDPRTWAPLWNWTTPAGKTILSLTAVPSLSMAVAVFQNQLLGLSIPS